MLPDGTSCTMTLLLLQFLACPATGLLIILLFAIKINDNES